MSAFVDQVLCNSSFTVFFLNILNTVVELSVLQYHLILRTALTLRSYHHPVSALLNLALTRNMNQMGKVHLIKVLKEVDIILALATSASEFKVSQSALCALLVILVWILPGLS